MLLTFPIDATLVSEVAKQNSVDAHGMQLIKVWLESNKAQEQLTKMTEALKTMHSEEIMKAAETAIESEKNDIYAAPTLPKDPEVQAAYSQLKNLRGKQLEVEEKKALYDYIAEAIKLIKEL